MVQLKFLTDDIEELDVAEHELEQRGIDRSRIHVLSNDNSELEKHDLPVYSDWSKRDIAHSGVLGVIVGLLCASAVIGIAVISGANTTLEWTMAGFIALCLLGFCTWEGGLVGVSRLNHRFAPYGSYIDEGQHLLVVDSIDQKEAQMARKSIRAHAALRQVE